MVYTRDPKQFYRINDPDVRAHAHIKKINQELAQINDYKLALNRENYKITVGD